MTSTQSTLPKHRDSDFSQSRLNERLLKFIKIKFQDEKLTQKQEEQHKIFVERIEKDLDGLCFGYSLTRSAMRMVGKSNWWKAALIAVANWSGKEEDLLKTVDLPGSESQKPVQLREIFNRVLNYVISNHGLKQKKSLTDFYPEGIEQNNILLPDEKNSKHFFEILKGHEVLTVKQHGKTAGNFNLKQLSFLLDEKQMTGNLCLIHCAEHTIEVNYENGKYVVYDPDYKDPLEKEFDTKKDAIQEIIRLTQLPPFVEDETAISIEIASCDPKSSPIVFPEVEKATAENPVSLLKGLGLSMIAGETPHRLSKILQGAIEAKQESLPEIIVEALTNLNAGTPALHDVAGNAPDQLPILLAIASKSEKAKNLIPLAIMSKDSFGHTGFEIIEKFAPNCIKTAKQYLNDYLEKELLKSDVALDYVASLPGGKDRIASALASNPGGLLNIVTARCHDVLEKAVGYAKQSATWPNLAANLLTTKNKFESSGLQMLLYDSVFKPSTLDVILEATCQSDIGADQILLALAASDDEQKTGRALIKEKKYKQNLPKIVDAFAKSLKMLSPHQLKKMHEDLENAGQRGSIYHGLLKKSPGYFHNLFSTYSTKNTLLKSLITLVKNEIAKESSNVKEQKKGGASA